MFPPLNPQVKCAFRWRKEGETYLSDQWGDKEGVGVVRTPTNVLPPFQFRDPDGGGYPTVFAIKDRSGATVHNLISAVPIDRQSTSIGTFYLYYGQELGVELAPGVLYYAEIVTSSGKWISEVFAAECLPGSGTSGRNIWDEDGFGDELDENGDRDNWDEEWGGEPPDQVIPSLRWRNCGNLGSQLYDTGFLNILYLDPATKVKRITPQLDVEQEADAKQEQVDVFTRRDTDYSIDLGPVNHAMLDAVYDMPLHGSIGLYWPALNRLNNVRVSHTWNTQTDDGSEPTALVTISFRIDDETVNAGCCVVAGPVVEEPCDMVYGYRGEVPEEELVFGRLYLERTQNRIMEYTDGEFGPWRFVKMCANGLVDMDIDGTLVVQKWDPIARVWSDFVEIEVFDAGEQFVVKCVPPERFLVGLEYYDGSAFTDVPGSRNRGEAEWAVGIMFDKPEDIESVRMYAYAETVDGETRQAVSRSHPVS